jgi:hypothetical protein
MEPLSLLRVSELSHDQLHRSYVGHSGGIAHVCTSRCEAVIEIHVGFQHVLPRVLCLDAIVDSLDLFERFSTASKVRERGERRIWGTYGILVLRF